MLPRWGLRAWLYQLAARASAPAALSSPQRHLGACELLLRRAPLGRTDRHANQRASCKQSGLHARSYTRRRPCASTSECACDRCNAAQAWLATAHVGAARDRSAIYRCTTSQATPRGRWALDSSMVLSKERPQFETRGSSEMASAGRPQRPTHLRLDETLNLQLSTNIGCPAFQTGY